MGQSALSETRKKVRKIGDKVRARTSEAMETQKYLREHGLNELLKNFTVKAKRHAKYPNLIQIKYDQITSSFKEAIVQECRGKCPLILRTNCR